MLHNVIRSQLVDGATAHSASDRFLDASLIASLQTSNTTTLLRRPMQTVQWVISSLYYKPSSHIHS